MESRWMIGVMCMLLGGVAAAETVYRWQDAKGQVNYGTQPPPGVRAEPIGGRGSVSVMPAPPPAAATPPAEDATAARVERLERELEEERQARRDDAARRDDEDAQRVRTRAECERQYREPCDEEGRPLSTRYIVRPARPYPAPGVQHWPRDERPDRPRPDGGRDEQAHKPEAKSGRPAATGDAWIGRQPQPQPQAQRAPAASGRGGAIADDERRAPR